MKTNKPANKFRVGCVEAAVWLNRNEKGDEWYSIDLKRSYKDGDEWIRTTTWRRDDLPLVAKAADMAFTWIWAQSNLSRPQPEPVSEAAFV